MLSETDREDIRKALFRAWVFLILLPFGFYGYVIIYKQMLISTNMIKLLIIVYGFCLFVISLVLMHITNIDRATDPYRKKRK